MSSEYLDEGKELSVQNGDFLLWEGVPHARPPKDSEAVLMEVNPPRMEGF